MLGFDGISSMTAQLSKPVLDRIRRYAKEGRQLRAQYGPGDCVLLASKAGQHPVVILRATRVQFTEMRGAALVAWIRAEHPKGSLRCREPRPFSLANRSYPTSSS